MNTSEYLATLYKIIEKLSGPRAARQAVQTAMSNVMFDIEEEGIEVTAQEIEKRIESYVQDFIEVDQKNNAA